MSDDPDFVPESDSEVDDEDETSHSDASDASQPAPPAKRQRQRASNVAPRNRQTAGVGLGCANNTGCISVGWNHRKYGGDRDYRIQSPSKEDSQCFQ